MLFSHHGGIHWAFNCFPLFPVHHPSFCRCPLSMFSLCSTHPLPHCTTLPFSRCHPSLHFPVICRPTPFPSISPAEPPPSSLHPLCISFFFLSYVHQCQSSSSSLCIFLSVLTRFWMDGWMAVGVGVGVCVAVTDIKIFLWHGDSGDPGNDIAR